MPQKTFKIGEYAKHGIIRVKTKKDSVTNTIELLDFDSKKVMERKTFHIIDKGALQMWLEDEVTTPYYADKVIDYLYD